MNKHATLPDRVLKIMAYDRQTFKNRVMEKLDGALGHFYMARLAELHGERKWVEHWRGEVERLLYVELEFVLSRPIKGKWDRRRAVGEVITESRNADPAYRRAAENAIKRYYGLGKIKHKLPEKLTDEFYGMVYDVLGTRHRSD